MAREGISTSREYVDSCNELARTFYKMQGYEVPEGYRFDQAHHPAEVGCWNLAAEAFDHIDATDINDCLSDLDE